MNAEQPDPSASRLERTATAAWRFLVIAAAVVVLAIALAKLALVVLPLIAALFLAALLHPVFRRLRTIGLPAAAAALLAVLAGIAVLAGAIAVLVPRVADQFDRLDVNITGGLNRIEEWLMDGPLGLSEGEVARATSEALDELRGHSDVLTERLLSSAVIVLEVLAGALLALVLCFFLLKDGRKIWSWLLGLAAPARRRHIEELGERGWETLGAYLRGLSISAFVEAVMVAILLLVLGVPLVLSLAALTFAGAFIPFIGAVVVGLLAALVALFSEGFQTALLVVVGFVVVQQLEGNVLHPFIVGRSVELHPIAVVLAVVTGGLLAGIIGAFLAVPLTALASVALAYARETAPAGQEP